MNNNKTLIAYATKSGATEENANIIANILRDIYNLEVDIINLKKTKLSNLNPYNNVIIGSGIWMGKWYKNAIKFLKKDFTNKKVAIYISSLDAGDPKRHDQALTNYLQSFLTNYSNIKPLAIEAFGGRLKHFKHFDNRNVGKVKDWANEIGKKFNI